MDARLVGVHLRAHRGVDPVRADEQRAALLPGLTVTVRAGHGDRPVGVLLVARDAVPQPDRVRTGPRLEDLREQQLEVAAVQGVLGPPVAGEEPARLAVDLAPVATHERPLARRHPDAVERFGADAQVVELAHRVGLQVDPDAQRRELARPLEDRERHADLVQGQPEGQPADAATRDQDARGAVHAAHPTLYRSICTESAARAPVPTNTRRLSHR